MTGQFNISEQRKKIGKGIDFLNVVAVGLHVFLLLMVAS
jgi:hypothetical protein